MKAAKRGEQDRAVCGAGSERRVGERGVGRGGEQARTEWPAAGWSWSARRSCGQAADCLGWSENACGGERVRDRYGEEYVNRSWTGSGDCDCDTDDGGIWWFKDGVVGDGLVEYGDYRGDMMKADNNMRELIPYFDSDNASVESAEDFWWWFETATERFDDATRLRMFAARIRGTVGERWRLNSRLTDFETLKRRFYNRFIRLTKEQLLQRLFDATQETDELVDDWGRRIARYCDEARLFKEALRYTAFKNGLRSDRVRKFLECLPDHSIEAACEWVVAKGLHLPERGDRSADRRARRDAPEVSQNDARRCGSGVRGESEEDGQEARMYGLARIVKYMQLERQRRTDDKYEEVARSWTVRKDKTVRSEKAGVGATTSDVTRRHPAAREWIMDSKRSGGYEVSAVVRRSFGADIDTKGELEGQGVRRRLDTEAVNEAGHDKVDPAKEAVLVERAVHDVAFARVGETVAGPDSSSFVVTENLMKEVMEADSVENEVVAAAPDSNTSTVTVEDHEVVVPVGPFQEETMSLLGDSADADNDPEEVIESEECVSVNRDTTGTVFEGFGLFQCGVSCEDKTDSSESNSDGSVAKPVDCVNIDVPLEEGEGVGAADRDALDAGSAESTVISPSEMKGRACKTVCRLPKEEKCEPQDGPEEEEALLGDAGTVDVLHWCDKAPVLNWELVRWLGYCVAKVLSVVNDYWKLIMEWVGNCFEESAAWIWYTLWERFKETHSQSLQYRPRRRDWRFVCFDGISLGPDYADVVFVRSEGASDASNYVQVVYPERPPPERDRSQVIVDNDATLSHVGHRLLERLGRSAKPLKPCDGQGTTATGGFECEYRRNGVPVDVAKAEVKSGAKITKRNGQHVNGVLVESSWNGQVECLHGCDRKEDDLEEKFCTLTRNHAETACCSEVSFGALVGGTLVDDGAICEGLGEESNENERFGAAATDFRDHSVCFVEEVVGTFDGECFDTVVTVISCDAFPESSEDQAKWATVTDHDSIERFFCYNLVSFHPI